MSLEGAVVGTVYPSIDMRQRYHIINSNIDSIITNNQGGLLLTSHGSVHLEEASTWACSLPSLIVLQYLVRHLNPQVLCCILGMFCQDLV